ncbi:PQQ-binding-like beta-propeller repeat protein [Verrucomicrobiota bacterium]
MKKAAIATAVLASITTLAAAADPLPADFAKNSPTFRGANGSGLTNFKNLPTSWKEGEKNILWKTKIPLPGWSCPIVWGDKVIAMGANAETRAVYCLDAKTGKPLWTTKAPADEKATADYAVDSMDQRWDILLYAGATPATDGKKVFAAFSNGQLIALDLADGKVAWKVALGDTADNTYGLDNSLLIYGKTVIVVFEGGTQYIAAFDAATGKQVWKTERESATWASPILIKTKAGKYQVVLPADPDVTAWDPENGKKLWSVEVLTGGPEYCVGPSPVYAADTVCVNCQNCGIYGIDPVAGKKVWGLEELPDGSGFPDGTSMATDGKHIYQYFSYSLTCIDAKTGKVVAQKEMDDEANYASPAVNNGTLYLFGGMGATMVKADPKANFADVGKGEIDDMSDAAPAIVDGKIFIRSDDAVYCIGSK